ncbi:MAG: WYL domain-containing protein, partial [Actinomycetota bacterium]|nr:WYL domain-containing protein [Actinomycetota bacterium]
MPRRSKEETFRIISAALAIIEEGGSVLLAQVAERVGVTRDALHEMLEPVLYHEFSTTEGDLVSKVGAFLLDADDYLHVTEDNWLRSLASEPPDFDTALRLFVAGTVYRSLSSEPAPNLDRALRKLEQTIAADVIVAIDSPPHLGVVERASSLLRTLRIRYVNDRGEARDRTIEPWLVFSNWGRWYVRARDLENGDAKWFRVDRIVSAELGATQFEPPPDTAIPDWFDLGGEETVTLRLSADAVDALPTPRRVDALANCGDGMVEATVTVHGRQRLERLLVTIPATADVVAPA